MDLRSKNVTQGVERAPNRSLFYAMGYTKEELERPLIGVVSAHSEIVPGHFHLDKLTEAVKACYDSVNRRMRRYSDGSYRYEILSAVTRAYCRQR